MVGKVPDIQNQNQNQNLDSKSESESDRRILGIVGKVPDMQNPDCRSQTTHVLDLFVSVGIWTFLPIILAKKRVSILSFSGSCLLRINDIDSCCDLNGFTVHLLENIQVKCSFRLLKPPFVNDVHQWCYY